MLWQYQMQRSNQFISNTVKLRNCNHANWGRDHGFPGFCCYYKLHQDPNFDCNSGWDKKYDGFSDNDWTQLQSVYAKPSDIDLFTGGLMQKPFNGGLTGKVFNEMKGNFELESMFSMCHYHLKDGIL